MVVEKTEVEPTDETLCRGDTVCVVDLRLGQAWVGFCLK